MKLRILVFAAAAVLAAPCLFAQIREGTVEIEPFAGYLWGGHFDRGTTAIFDQSVDVEDHFTYGGRIGYNFTSLVEFESMFQRTETNFVAHTSSSGPIFGPPGQDVRLGKLTIDYYMGYTTFNFGHSRFVPYVSFGLGAAHLNPDVPNVPASSDTRFTTSVAGGVKLFATPHFGFRFDGRYLGTSLGDHGHCDCSHSDWLSNWTTTGGLLFAF